MEQTAAVIKAIRKPFKRLLSSSRAALYNKILETFEEQLQSVLQDTIKEILLSCGDALKDLDKLNLDDFDKVLDIFSFDNFLDAVKDKVEGIADNLKELPSVIDNLTSLDELTDLVKDLCEKCLEMLSDSSEQEQDDETPESAIDKISEKLAEYITEKIMELVREIISDDNEESSEKQDDVDGKSRKEKKDEGQNGERKFKRRDQKEKKDNGKEEKSRTKQEEGEKTEVKTPLIPRLLKRCRCFPQKDKFLAKLKKELSPALINKIEQVVQNGQIFLTETSKKSVTATIEDAAKNSPLTKEYTDSVSSTVAGNEGLEVSSTIETILKIKELEDFIQMILDELNQQYASKEAFHPEKNEKVIGDVCHNVAEYITELTVKTVAENY